MLSLLLCISVNLFGVTAPPDPTSVFTEVQWENIYENQPIEGFISVTHDKQFKVDEQSFTINGQPLKVTFDKEVSFSPSSPLSISIYKFQVPGMARGLQILPEISVKVNGKIYKSPPISFQVQGLEKQIATMQPSLKLETIGGENALYPGSRTQVGYRYIYNTNIELTAEYLPLLDVKNFRKIGDKDIKDVQEGIVTIHTILQNVEAIEPGTFTYGPSVVEGNAYQERGGKKIYLQPKLVAEAPIVTLTVKDFPAEGKPASFNGAVGQFTFKVAMETANQVRLGDKIELRLDISGSGQLENVKSPDLCCQPGFSGLFKTSDLPPAGKITGNTKTFQVEIYPLSVAIDSVPPIEFSYFNPAKEKYESIISPGIPITILPAPQQQKEEPLAVSETAIQPIQGVFPLKSSDLHDRFMGTYWVLGLIPAGLIAIFFQYALIHDKEKQKNEKKLTSSKDLFQQAIAETDERAFFANLQSSFQLLLFEKGFIQNSSIAIEDLPDQFEQIKLLFADRFSNKPKLDRMAVIKQAEALFKQYSSL